MKLWPKKAPKPVCRSNNALVGQVCKDNWTTTLGLSAILVPQLGLHMVYIGFRSHQPSFLEMACIRTFLLDVWGGMISPSRPLCRDSRSWPQKCSRWLGPHMFTKKKLYSAYTKRRCYIAFRNSALIWLKICPTPIKIAQILASAPFS